MQVKLVRFLEKDGDGRVLGFYGVREYRELGGKVFCKLRGR
jgi:hypothetical protein